VLVHIVDRSARPPSRTMGSSYNLCSLSGHLLELVVSMGSVIGTKLVLWILCRVSADPGVQTLAQDHIFDVISNAFGLTGAYLAGVYPSVAFLDPMVAILLSLFFFRSWAGQARDWMKTLVGRSADAECFRRVTAMALYHDERVLSIERVRAYLLGSRVWCEIDLHMDPDTALRVAHDVGERLQYEVECLEEVERCFVHVDHDIRHVSEHGDAPGPRRRR
jgi:divalent metal cation (Fe/Co/Zn/Cd) transporter